MEVFDLDVNNPLNNEKEESCLYCGESSDRDFCSRSCYKAYLND